MTTKIKCFTVTGLKVLAMVCMLFDHAWATVIPGNLWLHVVGRMAFPIFAFQLAEGFALTGDRRAYIRRMFLFALISEIPFDLMMGGTVFYPFQQNVMFTFWLSLLIMGRIEKGRQRGGIPFLLSAPGWSLLGFLAGILLMVDYNGFGVLMVLIFYFTREMRPALRIPLQGLGMFWINWVMMKGRYIPLTLAGVAIDPPIQAFALLALIPIWLYNGQKGRGYELVKPLGYWFYPGHILLLSVTALYLL